MTQENLPPTPTPAGWYHAQDGPYERWWNGAAWGNESRPLGAEAHPTMSAASRAAGWGIVAFGVLAVLGAMLPWVSIGFISVAGTSGDGVLTLVMGVVAAGIGIGRGVAIKSRGVQIAIPIVAGLIGILIVLIGVYDASQIDGTFGTIGSGLVLTILAGLGLSALSLFGLIKRA